MRAASVPTFTRVVIQPRVTISAVMRAQLECVQPHIGQTELMAFLLGTVGMPDYSNPSRIFTMSKLKAIHQIIVADRDAGEPAVIGNRSQFNYVLAVKTTKWTGEAARSGDMATEPLLKV